MTRPTDSLKYTIGRDTTRLGSWYCTANGKTTYHFRKAEAVARGQRVTHACPPHDYSTMAGYGFYCRFCGEGSL